MAKRERHRHRALTEHGHVVAVLKYLHPSMLEGAAVQKLSGFLPLLVRYFP